MKKGAIAYISIVFALLVALFAVFVYNYLRIDITTEISVNLKYDSGSITIKPYYDNN